MKYRIIATSRFEKAVFPEIKPDALSVLLERRDFSKITYVHRISFGIGGNAGKFCHHEVLDYEFAIVFILVTSLEFVAYSVPFESQILFLC